MRSIKKVQMDCNLLHIVSNGDSDISDGTSSYIATYSGYIFDKTIKYYCKQFQYSVYIPEIKLASRFTTNHDLPEYSNHNFKLYLLRKEHNVKQKIKLILLE